MFPKFNRYPLRDHYHLPKSDKSTAHALRKSLVVHFFILTLLPSEYGVLAFLSAVGLIVVVVMLFYVHGKHLRSSRDSQLT